MFSQSIQNTRARRRMLCLWAFIAAFLLPARIFAGEGDEYAVKAAFILNFTKAAHWPDDLPAKMSLCLVGKESLSKGFESIDGKQVGRRVVRVRRIATASDSDECAILFISDGTDRATQLRFLTALKNKPVLIIGETLDFVRIGGIINFIQKDGKLHFEINPQEAERHGLKISSQVLQLATIVEED